MLMHFTQLGLTRTARRRALADEVLTKAAPGWYAPGPRPAGIERWLLELAAQTARYPDGRLAGEAAAALLGLDGFDPGAPVTVYRPRTSSGRTAGVRRLDALDGVIDIDGLPVCSVDELLLGLGAEVTPRPGCDAAVEPLSEVELVELAVEAALRRELTTIARLTDIVGLARPNRPGRPELRVVLGQRPAGAPPTESYLETRFIQVLRRARLPAFDRQAWVHDADGPIGRVDFLYRRVVAELVGRRWHLDRFDPDHARYARLAAAGYRVLPFTFDDVERHPRRLVRTVAAALRTGQDFEGTATMA